jgi:hypothetical protein
MPFPQCQEPRDIVTSSPTRQYRALFAQTRSPFVQTVPVRAAAALALHAPLVYGLVKRSIAELAAAFASAPASTDAAASSNRPRVQATLKWAFAEIPDLIDSLELDFAERGQQLLF